MEGKHFLVETEDDTKESSPDTLQDYVLSKVNNAKNYILSKIKDTPQQDNV